MSPWRLPGEPNRASAVWLAAGDQTSLGGVSRLFSRSSLISTNTYIIICWEKQEEIRVALGKGWFYNEKKNDESREAEL